MKKINYIFSIALLCMVACTREVNPVQTYQTTSVAPKDGDMARVTFYVTVPEASLFATQTRAWDDPLAEEPKGIANGDLFVAVFGKGSAGTAGLGGQLQHLLKARLMNDHAEPKKGTDPPITHNYSNGTYVYAYEVLMPISEDPLVLDFFAGAYDSKGNLYNLENPLPVEYEKDVMPLLLSKVGNAAYWQRIEISGVFPKPDPDNPGQYVLAQVYDDDGVPIPQENQDYEAKDIPELHNVRLIRNFAKVTFTAARDADFDILSFRLIDVPVSGTVAPYSATTGYSTDYSNPDKGATDIMKSYKGYIRSTELTGSLNAREQKSSGSYDYMYERTVPDLNKPFAESGAILKVKWKASSENASLGTRYYKVSFVDKDGAVPILRNIVYNFQVEAITTDTHPEDEAVAYAGPWLGDISANIATAMLDEITNQKSLIKVSEMSKTFIGEGGEDKAVDINFWFYPDVQNHPTDVRVINGVTYQGQTVTIQVILEDVSGHQHAVDSWSNTTPASGATMGTIHVVPSSSVTGSVKRSKLKILGQWGTQRALYREVEFTVMEKQAFAKGDIECTVTPLASDAANQDVTVTIALPDELPRDIFPLQIKIEPENNGLRSVPVTIEGEQISALPVKHGKSAFDANKNNYYFVKTITFDDYARLEGSSYKYTNSFPCYFKTRLSTGNATDIKINDLNEEYFVESKVTLQ